MPHSEANDNLEEKSKCKILSLVADETTEITLSDLPVFGANLTFREDIATLQNSIVDPSQLIGWIDCSSLTKLACLNQQHYFDAQHFMRVKQNQLFFSKTVKVHTVNTDLNSSKKILTFSIVPESKSPVVVKIKG
jgi:hypothetical protein